MNQLPNYLLDPDPERIFLTANHLVLDFEIDTSHGDYGHPVHPRNQMLLACWTLGPGHPAFSGDLNKVYRLWEDEYHMGLLLEHLAAAELLVAHQAKYELGWLQRCGFDIGSIPVFCTKIAEYVLCGNLKVNNSLDACCKRRGWRPKDPVVDHMMKAGVNPVDIPRKWLLGRCEQDVLSTRDLYVNQTMQLRRTNRLGVLLTRCLLTPVLADMEMQGMRLDEDLVREAHAEATQRKAELEIELQRICGNINLNSDKQLGEFLYETMGFEELTNRRGEAIRTAGGKPKTDTDTIAALKAKTAEQREFLELFREYNSVSSKLSKYLDFYLTVVEHHDGVFYATFNQTVTKTHRLSSSGMRIELVGMLDAKGKQRFGGTQFQNQPNEFKKFFRAKEDGWYFTEEDGSGLEFRVAGLIGGDDMIKQDINDPDFDPHRRSASIINDIEEDEVNKEQRRKAKAHTFKPLFGGQSGTEGEKRYYAAFNERYSGLVSTQERWLSEALATKRLILPWGMRFYYPYIRMNKQGYVNERTKVFNAPIQSFATAEIIPIQAVYLWHMVRAAGLDDGIRLVNTVHDSVLAEVEPAWYGVYKDCVLESWKEVYKYTEKVYGMKLEGLPLGTEIVRGTHWGSGEEEAYNVWPDGRVEAA